MWRQLLDPSVRSAFSQLTRGTRPERIPSLLFILFGVGFWAGLLGASILGIDKLLGVEVFGIYLVRKLLSMLLLALLGLLCFSNLVAAISSYYLADDLTLLRAMPVSLRDLHRARFASTFATSSVMALLFGTPLLIALGVTLHAPPVYYLGMVVFLAGYMAVPTGVGVLAATVAVAVFPARRARDVTMAVSLTMVIGLLLLLRFIQPERLMNAEDFSDMISYLTQLQAPTASWTPAAWGVEILMSLATGQRGDVPWYLGLSVLTGISSFIVSGWAVLLLYERSYNRAQEGSSERDLGPGLADRLLQLGTRPLPRPMAAVIVKDIKSFLRDSAEWPQLLLILALMAIYLYSIKSLPLKGPMITYQIHNVIAFVNLGMVGFVLSSLAVRFLFTSVSVEGRAFWMLQAAPLSPSRFLLAKWLLGAPALLAVGLTLVLISNWMLETTLLLRILGIVTVVALSLSLSGLSVGMGALYPNFKAEHIAKIPASPGGILFMFVSLLFVALVIVLEAVPVFFILRASYRHRELVPWEWAVTVGMSALALVPLILAGLVPMRRGARALEPR